MQQNNIYANVYCVANVILFIDYYNPMGTSHRIIVVYKHVKPMPNFSITMLSSLLALCCLRFDCHINKNVLIESHIDPILLCLLYTPNLFQSDSI